MQKVTGTLIRGCLRVLRSRPRPPDHSLHDRRLRTEPLLDPTIVSHRYDIDQAALADAETTREVVLRPKRLR